MAKKPKKQIPKKINRFNFKKPSHLVIAVLLLVAVGLLAKNQFDIYQDRQLFKRAEAKTEDVYGQIVETIGEPDKVVREKSCGRANLKFSEGPLVCNTTLHVMISNLDISDVNYVFEKITKLSSFPLRSASATTSSFSIFRVLSDDQRQEFHQKVSGIHNLACNLSYEYPVNNKSAYYNLLMPQSHENLRIGISCGGPAKAEHYPIRD